MKTIRVDLVDAAGKKAFLDRFSAALSGCTRIPMNYAVIGDTEITIRLNDVVDEYGTECLLDACAKTIYAEASATIVDEPVMITCSGSCGKRLTVRQLIADAERYIVNRISMMDADEVTEFEDKIRPGCESQYLQDADGQAWMPWCGRKDCQI